MSRCSLVCSSYRGKHLHFLMSAISSQSNSNISQISIKFKRSIAVPFKKLVIVLRHSRALSARSIWRAKRRLADSFTLVMCFGLTFSDRRDNIPQSPGTFSNHSVSMRLFIYEQHKSRISQAKIQLPQSESPPTTVFNEFRRYNLRINC